MAAELDPNSRKPAGMGQGVAEAAISSQLVLGAAGWVASQSWGGEYAGMVAGGLVAVGASVALKALRDSGRLPT